jgi:hypothetical protein
VEENQENMQELWNEEAAILQADDTSSAQDEIDIAEPVEKASSSPEPVIVEPEDPLAGLSDTVRAKLAQIDELAQANTQLLHHVKTTEGRVAAMQRDAELARRQVADAPSQKQIVTATANPEKWDQLKEDFPEWAGAMEEYVTAKMAGVSQQQQSLTPEQVAGYVQQQVSESRQEMARELEKARIEGKHDDWETTVNTPEFANWFSVQTPETRALAGSPAAKDAIRMLDMFQSAKAKPASEIKQERGARLAAAVITRPGQVAPPKTLDDLSPEELWNYEAAKREKTKSQRGY